MELSGARVLVCGATGVLGGLMTDALVQRGARVVPAGRRASRLAELEELCGNAAVSFDAVDVDSCRHTVAAAVETLGGLDGLVVAFGVAAFGPAADADAAVTEELFAVNTLAPMSLVRAAAEHLGDGGFLAVFSAILADLPTAGMAEYSASKSALASWLAVVRRELRPRTVIDVRPPHLDTGLDSRALAGTPPKLPEPLPASQVVDAVIEAIETDAREVVWDGERKGLVVR